MLVVTPIPYRQVPTYQYSRKDVELTVRTEGASGSRLGSTAAMSKETF